MSPERFEQIARLFGQACQLSDGDRATFLERHCAEPDVRREVDALLAEDRRIGDATLGGPERFVAAHAAIQQARSDLIKGLFDRACGVPQGQRSAWLDEQCADPELRAQVEALLEADDALPDGFMRGPAAQVERNDTAAVPHHNGTAPSESQYIGPYRILELIGEGGMGMVYRAEQRQPVKRQVALKIIKMGMDTRQVVARFEAERQALALMDHPNIARVLDAGATEGGRPFFVMQLVDGMPITEYCANRQLGMVQRLRLVVDVCRAVQHAHSKGIIHRDIKPSNILVAETDGRAVAKVIDFGVAKAVDQRLTERTLFTEIGQLVGTPAYMSPEQADLASRDIDTRTDVYALGVLLYELLTGTTPFDPRRLRAAAYSEIQRIIREEEPPTPSTRLSSLGAEVTVIGMSSRGGSTIGVHALRGDLDCIVMKALAKEREQRYETVNGLAMDIERFLNDEPVLATPPDLRHNLSKFVRRHRGPVAAGTAVLLALVSGLILATAGFIEASAQRDRATSKADLLRRQLYTSRIARAQAAVETDARDLLKPLLTSCDEDLRSWEWERLWWLADRSDATHQAHDDRIVTLRYTSDGTRIMSSSISGTVRLWDAGSFELIREFHTTEPDQQHFMAALSADDTLLALCNDRGTIHIWATQTGTLLHTWQVDKPDIDHIMSVAVDAQHGRVAVGRWFTATDIYALDGTPYMTLSDAGIRGQTLEFLDGGHTLLVGSLANDVSLWDIDRQRIDLRIRASDYVVWNARLSPDRQHIATIDGNDHLWWIDLEDRSTVFKIDLNKDTPRALAVHPGGRVIAVAGNDGIITLFGTEAGARCGSFRGHEAPIGAVCFHPDGRDLLSADRHGVIKRWHLAAGSLRAEHIHQNQLDSVQFTPDGAHVIFGGAHTGVRTLDVEDLSVDVAGDPAEYVQAAVPSATGAWVGAKTRTDLPHREAVILLDGERRIVQRWPVRHVRGSYPTHLAFSRDERLFLFHDDGAVVVWDLREKRARHRLAVDGDPVHHMLMDPEDARLITAHASGLMRAWDLHDGAVRFTAPLADGPPVALAFTHAGDRLLTIDPAGAVSVRSWPDLTTRLTLRSDHPIGCLAVMPDDRRVVTGGRDNAIRLWSLEDGSEVMVIGRHRLALQGVACSPDGRTIATCGHDHRLILWETGPPVTGFDARLDHDPASWLRPAD